MKVGFYTLGCKVNIYESNALMNEFSKAGFEVVKETEAADAYIVNTCSVTNNADSKSRQSINKLIKAHPDSVMCIMGCFSQTNKTALEIKGVDIILGNGNKGKAVELVREAINNRKTKVVDILDIRETYNFEKLEATTFDHTRAFVKIEDGCSNFCTYCIIPYARGPVRCKPKNEVIDELKKIVKLGYREIVFAGIHTGRYESGEGYHLSNLIEEVLASVPEIKRLRLSSIEINEIDDHLLSLMKSSKVIANHLHLPLQSGCDKILKLMNRHYDTNFFLEKIKKIRSIRPDISITTDVLTGFPYETDDDFNDTVEFIKKVNFAELHVFPYSMRKGTKAALMPQVDGIVKKERTKKLIELSNELNYEYNKKFIGKELDVIIESKDSDLKYMHGHTSNYLMISVPYDENYYKKHVQVVVESVDREKNVGILKKY